MIFHNPRAKVNVEMQEFSLLVGLVSKGGLAISGPEYLPLSLYNGRNLAGDAVKSVDLESIRQGYRIRKVGGPDIF